MGQLLAVRTLNPMFWRVFMKLGINVMPLSSKPSAGYFDPLRIKAITEQRPSFTPVKTHRRRSQWPRGLRHELSSSARTLGSWVRIPLEASIAVCVYSVFVLFYLWIAALRRADPPSKEPYRLCKRWRNWKSSQDPIKGCRAIERKPHRRSYSFVYSNWNKPQINAYMFFFSFGATALIWALAYLHETLHFTSVY
jgi:hypothetical protein